MLHVAGVPIPLTALSIPRDVVDSAAAWVAQYDDQKLLDGSRDEAWIVEGQAVFDLLRTLLSAEEVALDDWEGIWDRQIS